MQDMKVVFQGKVDLPQRQEDTKSFSPPRNGASKILSLM
jgi:hypothetical protein